MNGRLIAIGDIHGCHLEFAELLAHLAPASGDRLILLGDLINRGPDSNRVLDLAREAKASSLLGNHELRLLEYRRTRDRKRLKTGDLETFENLRPEAWAYIAAMPLTFEDRDGRPAKRTDAPDAPAWADLWSGPPFVVYGHTPRREIYELKWSVGLDTGCVQGGALTAYILPEKRFLQVKARQRYWSR